MRRGGPHLFATITTVAPVRFTVASLYMMHGTSLRVQQGGSSCWAPSHLSEVAEDFCLDTREGLLGDQAPLPGLHSLRSPLLFLNFFDLSFPVLFCS